jgi:hypothetical protein
MLDEREFLSPYGLRALSKAHLDEPFTMTLGGSRFSVGYEPGSRSPIRRYPIVRTRSNSPRTGVRYRP